MSEKYKILSLCGGGVRGIMTATIMERLHQYNPKFLEEFDLLAGTSAGSFIISSLLGNYSAEGLGKRIADFMKDYQPQIKNSTNPSKPMHNIQDFVDSITALHGGNPELSSFDRKFLMTSFDLGDMGAKRLWNQMIFTNLDVPPIDNGIQTSGYGETPGMGIVDATVSSCAMGGMYGAYKFSYNGKTYYNVDGAFAHHDPTMIAIAYAVSIGISLEEIVVIDIGTGFMPQYLGSDDVAEWGCQQWVQAPEGDRDLVPDLLANQPFSVPVLDTLLNGTNSTLLEQQAALMLGNGDRYANINPQIKNVSETDNSAIPYLVEHGISADLTQAKKLIDLYW